jgi:hypothetical protein
VVERCRDGAGLRDGVEWVLVTTPPPADEYMVLLLLLPPERDDVIGCCCRLWSPGDEEAVL